MTRALAGQMPELRRPTYRDSHLGAGKASGYDRGFTTPGTVKHLHWNLEQRLLDRVFRENLPVPPKVALDFACGTGRVLSYLESRVERTYGIDVSPDMLDIARTRCHDSTLIRQDVTRDADVPIEPDVDVVTSFRFLLNADAPLRTAALHWIRERLAPEGRLVANFHLNPNGFRGRYLKARGLSDPMLSPTQSGELLLRAGFLVDRVYGYELLPYRREGNRPVLPGVRRLVEHAVVGHRWLTPVAGAFIVVARPTSGRAGP